MDVRAKVTSKGQITIPLTVRKKMGLKTGDTIIFKENDEDVMTVVQEKKESPFAKYRGIGNPEIDSGLKSINKYIREIRNFDPDDPNVK